MKDEPTDREYELFKKLEAAEDRLAIARSFYKRQFSNLFDCTEKLLRKLHAHDDHSMDPEVYRVLRDE